VVDSYLSQPAYIRLKGDDPDDRGHLTYHHCGLGCVLLLGGRYVAWYRQWVLFRRLEPFLFNQLADNSRFHVLVGDSCDSSGSVGYLLCTMPLQNFPWLSERSEDCLTTTGRDFRSNRKKPLQDGGLSIKQWVRNLHVLIQRRWWGDASNLRHKSLLPFLVHHPLAKRK